jgi:hypothetical protein
MKSYGRPSGGVLGTLLDLRVEGERQAERALAVAVGARRTAEVEAERLEVAVGAAQAAVAAARRDGGEAASGVRAADLQARRRYWARLEEQVVAAADVLARYRANELARAIDADAAAHAAHLRARQRREVVEKAIARRQAAARRETERRAEAELDDRAGDARGRSRPR